MSEHIAYETGKLVTAAAVKTLSFQARLSKPVIVRRAATRRRYAHSSGKGVKP
jgi:hypothetical protein